MEAKEILTVSNKILITMWLAFMTGQTSKECQMELILELILTLQTHKGSKLSTRKYRPILIVAKRDRSVFSFTILYNVVIGHL